MSVQPAKLPTLYSFASTDELVSSLADFVIEAQNKSVEEKERFSIAISGGSLPKMLKGLLGRREDVKWDKWHVYFADERVVPLDNEDSNYRLANQELFDEIPKGESKPNIHSINVDLLGDLEALRTDYKSQLEGLASEDNRRLPIFDLILLGMGPDGHTASLFPNHPLLNESSEWVAYITDSPKPPSNRITLTYPVINNASRVAFVAAGAGKQDTLAQILDDPHPEIGLPCSRVRPVGGSLYWFVDNAASAKVGLKKTRFNGKL